MVYAHLTLAAAVVFGGGWRDAMTAPAKPPPKKAEPVAKTCLCSPLCVCGCNAGKRCSCQVTQGAPQTPATLRPDFAISRPTPQHVVPSGVRSGNC